MGFGALLDKMADNMDNDHIKLDKIDIFLFLRYMWLMDR